MEKKPFHNERSNQKGKSILWAGSVIVFCCLTVSWCLCIFLGEQCPVYGKLVFHRLVQSYSQLRQKTFLMLLFSEYAIPIQETRDYILDVCLWVSVQRMGVFMNREKGGEWVREWKRKRVFLEKSETFDCCNVAILVF